MITGYATCPSCGQGVSTEPGQSVPGHQLPDGSRKKCAGGVGQ